MYGGERVSSKQMVEWSEKLSTEELHAKIERISQSLHEYLVLGETGTDAQIEQKFLAAAFDAAEAKRNVAAVRRFGKSGYHVNSWKNRWFQDQYGRGNATGLTTHSLEIVVALRDVAGLAWGGTEMSDGENGDFMHFDCRNEGTGQAILQFNRNNRTAQATT